MKGTDCPPACEDLLKMLVDPEIDIRKAALDVVTTYRGVKAWEPTLATLKDKKGPERAATIDAPKRRTVFRRRHVRCRELCLIEFKPQMVPHRDPILNECSVHRLLRAVDRRLLVTCSAHRR